MSSRYVEPGRPRHRIVMVDGVETLSIPYRRNWFVMIFLSAWLVGWAFGWTAAARMIVTTHEPFMLLWLAGWTAGGAFALSAAAMQWGGDERLHVTGGDLEVSAGVGPVRRSWRYRGSLIAGLSSWQVDRGPFGFGRGLERPFWLRANTGAVRFDYGAETVFLAAGVDEPEGRTIAAWLAKRLPGAAA